MLKHLRTYFFTGLLVLLPIVVSLKIIFWGFERSDAILGDYIARHLNSVLGFFSLQIQRRIPGLGLAVLLLIITLTGVIAHNYLGRKMITFGERILKKIPILNTIYNMTKQITDSIAQTQKEDGAFRKVVMVEYPCPGIYSPGFLTGDVPDEANEKTGKKLLGVFIPTPPNPATGFLVFIPEEEVTILDMSIEDGLKMMISIGVVIPKK